MFALQMDWHSSDKLEMQKSYMIQSPHKGLMKAVIAFQSFLGLASNSPYHRSNLSILYCLRTDPSLPREEYLGRPRLADGLALRLPAGSNVGLYGGPWYRRLHVRVHWYLVL